MNIIKVCHLWHHVGVDAVEVGIHKIPPVLRHLLTLLQLMMGAYTSRQFQQAC